MITCKYAIPDVHESSFASICPDGVPDQVLHFMQIPFYAMIHPVHMKLLSSTKVS